MTENSSFHFNGNFPGGHGLASTRMYPLLILLEPRFGHKPTNPRFPR